jgi:hypothetical protein
MTHGKEDEQNKADAVKVRKVVNEILEMTNHYPFRMQLGILVVAFTTWMSSNVKKESHGEVITHVAFSMKKMLESLETQNPS